MKINKIMLSIGLTSLLLGSNLVAAENDSLTRATVKLIKNYHNLEQKINNIDSGNLDNGHGLKKAQSDISSLNTETANMSNVLNSNVDKIKNLETSVKNVSAVSNEAKTIASQTQELVNEMRSISGNFKAQTSEVVGSAKVAYQKSAISETKVDSMGIALEGTSKEIKNTSAKVEDVSKRLNILNHAYAEHVKQNQLDVDVMNAKIDNMKQYYEAEIKVLKVKLDRTKPIYVIDKVAEKVDCSAGKCKDDSSDEVINNFIN